MAENVRELFIKAEDILVQNQLQHDQVNLARNITSQKHIHYYYVM